MKITISNKLLLQECPDILSDIILPELILDNPKFTSALKNGYSTFGIEEKLINYEIEKGNKLYVPRGYLSKIIDYCNLLTIPLEIKSKKAYCPITANIDSSNIKLRSYQSRALVGLTTSGCEGLLISPAGSGKTVIGLSLLPMLEQKTLWMTHTNPLATQVISRINKFLPSLKDHDIGIIGNGEWSIGNVITIALVQTLVRNMDKVRQMKNEFGLVIIDEAHHCPSTTFSKILTELAPMYEYGLTATPIRRDGLHTQMYQILGKILHTVPLEEVRKHGGIIIPKVRYKELKNNDQELNNYGALLKSLSGNTERTLEIVNDVVKEAKNGHISIVVTSRKLHAEELFKFLKIKLCAEVGIATGSYSKKDINKTISLLEEDKIKTLVTTSDLLGEGFDYAPIDRGFLCLPFRNATRTEQIVGRLQRTSDGKKDAIIYDYVDDHSLLKHQFYNKGTYGCRWNVYKKLGCEIEKR